MLDDPAFGKENNRNTDTISQQMFVFLLPHLDYFNTLVQSDNSRRNVSTLGGDITFASSASLIA